MTIGGPADGDGVEAASAEAAQLDPEGFAVSPALGGLPAIYVPRSATRAGTCAGLWRAIVRAARRASCLAARHLPHHHAASGGATGANTISAEKQ